MSSASVFQLISDITQRHGARCILIGGFAVNYYKVVRQTADVDFLIKADDFLKILDSLREAGYERVQAVEAFVQLRHPKPWFLSIDFMLVEEATFSEIESKGQLVRIAGQEFRVPSLLHLIALKLHSIKFNPKIRYDRDLPDIMNLIRINELDAQSPEFKEICEKFGPVGIYKRIVDAI